ncbi:MAG: DUF481 domain-containing protein [Gemmatimonadaceae bacterium]
MRQLLRNLPPALLVLLLVPPVVGAQNDKPKPFELSADLGYVNAQGNSDITTLNVGEKLVLRVHRWEHKQQFGSVYGSQDGKQSTSLIFANWRSDWSFSKKLALFGYAGYDRNQPAGIASRFEESLGLSAKLDQSDVDQWSIELGLGLNQQQAVDGSSRSFSSIRSATQYKHFFTKAAYIQQEVEYLPSLEVSEDYRIHSETALVAPVSSHISMKLGYVVRFDNLPGPTKRKSDRILTSGLQFNW